MLKNKIPVRGRKLVKTFRECHVVRGVEKQNPRKGTETDYVVLIVKCAELKNKIPVRGRKPASSGTRNGTRLAAVEKQNPRKGTETNNFIRYLPAALVVG